MKLTDLTEGRDPDYKIKSRRSSRLTMSHLLKMRRIREKKKIEQLRDRKIYTLMYSPDEGGGTGDF